MKTFEKTLNRLHSITAQPTAAIECIEQVYGRAIANDEKRVLLPEMVGMLNHLYFRGKLERTLETDGVYRYVAIDANMADGIG